MSDAGTPPDQTQVICPACTHQFRAIPCSVQQLMLDAGFEPPFTEPSARHRALAIAASQASFCLRSLLPDDPDAQMTVGMLDRALGRTPAVQEPVDPDPESITLTTGERLDPRAPWPLPSNTKESL